jgi:hypothetical protein
MLAPLRGWGSILLLAISILGFAYLFCESYLVTKK